MSSDVICSCCFYLLPLLHPFMCRFFFFFKQKTAYEMLRSLVGSEMCIRDRYQRRVRDTKSSNMKVVFLDIDGVVQINTPGMISQHLLGYIKTIVDKTGASIVLSSDWRRSKQGCDAVRRSLRLQRLDFIDPVSYTHLTLPTKRIV
eukprot:TRINITY_DN24151_c0_g1_i1.p1 TRINITY_DN24151_c0_g1~~TRINITY_DN24151_c0_g1_i1.p1  ORF type:complete len:146 (+),score=41.62 TRINITY_DN24151_c0_g1_i1:24-461(+)